MLAIVFKGNEIIFSSPGLNEMEVLVYKTLDLFTRDYSAEGIVEIENQKSKTCLLRDGNYLICYGGDRIQLGAIHERFLFYFNSLEDATILQIQQYFGSLTNMIPVRGIKQIVNPSFKSILALQRLQTFLPFKSELLLLYQKNLVYSTMKTFAHLKILYAYLTDPTIGLFDDSLVNQVKPRGHALISTPDIFKKSFFSRKESMVFTGYLIGGINNDTIVSPKYVYLSGTKTCLIVFQFQDVLTFAILTPIATASLTQHSWYKYLSSHLIAISTELKPLLKADTSMKKYTFMDYNEFDFVMRENPSQNEYLNDGLEYIRQQFNKYSGLTKHRNLENTREILVCLEKFWLCGLRLNSRQVYFVIGRSDVGLGGIEEEINKFKASFK